MKNTTSKTLFFIAWIIWGLGGLGSIIVYGSINEIFQETYFESIPGAVFFVSIFNVFCTGMIFFGLSTIIDLVNSREHIIQDTSLVKKDTLIGTSTSDDVLKF